MGSRDHALGGAAIVGAVLIVAAPARAHEPAEVPPPTGEGAALRVRWSAPPECPEEAALVQRIGALVPGASGGGVAVEVDLRREAAGLRAELVLRTPHGATERVLEAERCDAVLEATALLVAIAIEPLEAERALAREQTAAAVPPPRPELPSPPPRRPRAAPAVAVVEAPPEPPPEPPAEPARPPAGRSRFTQGTVRLEGGVGAGPLPRPGTTAALAVGLRHGLWRVGAHGALWPAQQVLHPADRTVAATLRLWAAGVHACGGPRWGALELPVCLGLDAGAMRGQGRGALVQADAAVRPWVALRLGPALAWSPVPALALWLGVDVAATLSRPRFSIDPLGEIHSAGVVSGRAYVAVEVRLPGRSARFAQSARSASRAKSRPRSPE